MLGTSYQKHERARRRHEARMAEIFAEREDICRNCAFFKDGRFCVNPKHAEGNVWADQRSAVGSVMVGPTQGCELFEQARQIPIREPNPSEERERSRYAAERRAIDEASAGTRSYRRLELETRLQNRVGPIRNIAALDDDALARLVT
jgi:hypothetical protein